MHATAISDVLERSGAPRGSVYFHFPGGKPQLAVEAADAHAHEQVQYIDRAAEQADSAAGLVEVYLDLAREGMVNSDYTRGCGIAPLVTEAAQQESAEVGGAGRRGFSAITDRLAFHFVDFGLDGASARLLAQRGPGRRRRRPRHRARAAQPVAVRCRAHGLGQLRPRSSAEGRATPAGIAGGAGRRAVAGPPGLPEER